MKKILLGVLVTLALGACTTQQEVKPVTEAQKQQELQKQYTEVSMYGQVMDLKEQLDKKGKRVATTYLIRGEKGTMITITTPTQFKKGDKVLLKVNKATNTASLTKDLLILKNNIK